MNIKKFSVGIIAAAFALSFSGCQNPNSTNGTQVENVSKSPIDALSQEEKQIFNALLIASDAFYTPQSMKILNVKNLMDDDLVLSDGTLFRDNEGPRCLIEISAENRAGGNTKTEYVLWTSDWKMSDAFPNQTHEEDFQLHKKGEIIKFVDSKEHHKDAHDFENVNIGNLNRALDQYWQDMGVKG